jgi:hypothetical protein
LNSAAGSGHSLGRYRDINLRDARGPRQRRRFDGSPTGWKEKHSSVTNSLLFPCSGSAGRHDSSISIILEDHDAGKRAANDWA